MCTATPAARCSLQLRWGVCLCVLYIRGPRGSVARLVASTVWGTCCVHTTVFYTRFWLVVWHVAAWPLPQPLLLLSLLPAWHALCAGKCLASEICYCSQQPLRSFSDSSYAGSETAATSAVALTVKRLLLLLLLLLTAVPTSAETTPAAAGALCDAGLCC
jgi:hypothetical protein